MTPRVSSTYSFTAITRSGMKLSGVRIGRSAPAVVRDLQREGLLVASVRRRWGIALRASTMSRSEVGNGLSLLSCLLSSGLSLTSSLRAFSEAASPGWKGAVRVISARLREGTSFSASLEEACVPLTPVAMALIRAGEVAGDLAGGSDAAAQYTIQQLRYRAELVSALSYPALLLVGSLSSAALMVTVVIPQFSQILEGSGGSLPESTRTLLLVAEALRTSTPWLTFACSLAVCAVLVSRRRHDLRLIVDRLVLSVPLIGEISFSMSTARVTEALGALLRGGASLQNSLPIAARVAGNAEVERRLSHSRLLIQQGHSIAEALEATTALAPLSLPFVRTGEQSGTLAAMLSRAATVETNRARASIQRTLRFLEPLLIVGFGGAIALLASSLLQAVYSFQVN